MLFTYLKREEYRRESNLPPLLDNQPSPRRSRQLNVTQTSLWYINKKIIRDKNEKTPQTMLNTYVSFKHHSSSGKHGTEKPSTKQTLMSLPGVTKKPRLAAES